MTEIEELRQKIDQLESLVMSLMASSGEEESAGAASAPSAADCDYATPAEFDHEVVWDSQSSKWSVRYSTNTFTYGGATCEPENLEDGLVPVAAGSSVSVYGHAEISLADDGSVAEVSSLTYDTDPTGVTSPRPDADDSSSGETVRYDFLVATIEENVVYQNLTGALHVSASASVPTVDDVSLNHVESDDDEDGESEQENVVQIKNFDNEESNGSQGLCERISVVEEGEGSYKLSASSDSDVWILARVNGALKYIPLTGSEEPDPDEDDSSSCHDHPGDTDGVEPSDGDSHGGVDASGGVDGGETTKGRGSGITIEGKDGLNDHQEAEDGRYYTGDGEEVIVLNPDSEEVQVSDDVPSGGVEPSGGEGHSQSACGDCN